METARIIKLVIKRIIHLLKKTIKKQILVQIRQPQTMVRRNKPRKVLLAQGKKDATEKVKRTEKSSEQTLDTTANTSFKEVTHSPKKENIRVDSIILFVMIVALVAALILLKILLGKRKK